MLSTRLSYLLSKPSRVTLRAAKKPLLRRTMAAKLDSETIAKITEKESSITGQAEPVKGGPTSQAQKHAGENLTSGVISDITQGEKEITGGERVKGGPTSVAQSIASGASNTSKSTGSSNTASNTTTSASGILDSATISKITEKEKEITHNAQPAKDGPTAQAQKHANEPITSEALHDITEGEKNIAGERLKGGPTSAAQSELGKARNQGNA